MRQRAGLLNAAACPPSDNLREREQSTERLERAQIEGRGDAESRAREREREREESKVNCARRPVLPPALCEKGNRPRTALLT
eukprot:3241135-Pleurochrysis_carterae.AAC.3